MIKLFSQINKSSIPQKDREVLQLLNSRFISNFIEQNTASQEQIIHEDFICIQSNGVIQNREDYLKGWSTGYERSGYISFSITDERIRLFADMALVRSKTVYTKKQNGIILNGNSIYTDTYIKENGKWLCVQAQITPVV